MSSIDSRIVQMKFDNSRFERGVATTMRTLDKLKRALSFGKSGQSIDQLQRAANKFNLGGMDRAVHGVSAKFAALATVALTALASITKKALDAGLALGKSLTVQPVMDGFREYETKMGSIQTILSNTSRHGTTLKDVERNLDSLNTYADKTIYSFSDMTRNIGLFTNAGIGIDESTSMIKGFSNEAAASGTNSQGAASAAYQLSQALSAGTIRLMDWRSLQNVGMGNKNMQSGLIEIADAMGTFEGTSMTAKQAADDFNGSLEEKWLTADVMENYLKIQAGDLTKAQIKNLGLSDQQATALLKQQKIAEEAATKVRTFTQLIGTLQEAAGSGWAQTFDLVLGDFNEATEVFTGVEQAVGGMLQRQANARNKMIGEWVKLGGRDALIEGIANSWNTLINVLGMIRLGFRDVFPKTTGKQLYQMTVWFRNLTREFKMGGATAMNLRRTFRGFFSILGIGWEIIKGVVGVFADLFGLMFKNSGGFLEVTASIGDFFYRVHQGLKRGDGLSSFFENITKLLGGFGTGIYKAIGWVVDFIDSMDPFKHLTKLLGGFWDIAKKAFGGFADLLSEAFASGNFDKVLDVFTTGFLGGIFLAIRKFLKEGMSIDVGGGFLEAIGDTFGQLTDTLKAMQTQLQVKTLLSIAAAVGLLALSVVALSMIDSKKLTKALTALSVGFAQLLGAMAILVKIGGPAGVFQIMALAGALVVLSGAILILSAAVKVLSTMSWGELAKGLGGVAALLGIIAVASKVLTKNTKGMLTAAVAITAIAIALNLLAIAMKIMASMSLGEMGKALLGIAGSLAILAGAVRLFPKGMVATAAGLVAIGVALNLIASALKIFGSMDIVSMVTGLSAMGGALVVIALAVKLMPKNLFVLGAGLVAISVAVNLIAVALKTFGSMSWGEIAKGLVALGASLVILAIGVAAMQGTLLGSAALLIAAGAIAIFAPALALLGSLSWGSITKGLITLALALTILGVAGYLINVAALAILALGAALFLVGAGFALAGAGALAFATAFTMVVATGTAGALVLKSMLDVLITSIPKAMAAFAEGIIQFVVKIAEGIPQFIMAMGKLVGALLTVLIQAIPKIAIFMNNMMQAGLTVLWNNVPRMITVGFALMTAFLQAVANNIVRLTGIALTIMVRFANTLIANMPRIVSTGVRLIVSFLNGIARNMPRIITAGVNVVVRFLNGIAANIGRVIDAGSRIVIQVILGIGRHINRLVTAGTTVIVNFLNGIARNMGRIVTAGANIVIRMMAAIGRNLYRVTNAAGNIMVKLINGISKKMDDVRKAGTRAITKFVTGMGNSMYKVSQKGMDAMIKFLNGIARKGPQVIRAGTNAIVKVLNGIRDAMPRIIKAGADVIVAFLRGLEKQMPRITNQAFKTLIAFINGLTDAINKNQHKLNKAAQRLAKAIIDGMIWGLKWNAGKVGDAAIRVAKSSLKGAQNWLGINSPSKRWRDEVGVSIPEGMALGVSQKSGLVENETKKLAKSSLEEAKSAMSNLSSALSGDIDMNPVIRPVLDLTNVQNEASKMDLGSGTIKATSSYSGASSVASQLRSAREVETSKAQSVATKIEFNQHNNSPKALSEIEIYRQTKNQLSAAKGALSV